MNIRTFSETESLVIAELNRLGVTVTQDNDSSEYYVLECRKDGSYAELFHNDIDALYCSDEQNIKQYCTIFEKELTTKKPSVKLVNLESIGSDIESEF